MSWWHHVVVEYTDGREWSCGKARVEHDDRGWLIITLSDRRGEYEFPPQSIRVVRKTGIER